MGSGVSGWEAHFRCIQTEWRVATMSGQRMDLIRESLVVLEEARALRSEEAQLRPLSSLTGGPWSQNPGISPLEGREGGVRG